MTRLLGVIIGLPLLAVAASFAGSNLQPVEIMLFPLPVGITLPLALVVYIALVLGFLAGAMVAWLGAAHLRRRAHAGEAKARKAEAEAESLKTTAARNAERALDAPKQPPPKALAAGGRG